MIFCEICKKELKGDKYNLSRHNKTKKHIKLAAEYQEPEEKKENPSVLLSPEQVLELINQNKKFMEIVSTLQDEIKELKEEKPITNNNTTNNNTQNNTTNNTININFYGQENFKALLSKEHVKELGTTHLMGMFSKFLRIMYIDREENRNIKYTNMRSNKCKVLEGPNQWKVRNVNEVIGERIMNVGSVFQQSVEDYQEDTTEDVDDLLVLTQEMKDISKSGEKFIYGDSSMTKDKVKEIEKVKDDHKSEVYNV